MCELFRLTESGECGLDGADDAAGGNGALLLAVSVVLDDAETEGDAELALMGPDADAMSAFDADAAALSCCCCAFTSSSVLLFPTPVYLA